MGVTFALLAMLSFATNIMITRYAVARMPVESGFYVVLATNGYTGPVTPWLRRRLIPLGSYIIATEPLGEALAAEINPQNLAVCDSNLVLDYFRLSADKRMIFGGRCNYSNRDPKDIAAALKPRLVRVFPQLSDALEWIEGEIWANVWHSDGAGPRDEAIEPAAMDELSRTLSLADEVLRHKVLRIPEAVYGKLGTPAEQ